MPETNFVMKHSADSSPVGCAQNYPNEKQVFEPTLFRHRGTRWQTIKQRCHVSVSAMSRNALRKAFFQQISDLSVPKAAYILTKVTIILLNI